MESADERFTKFDVKIWAEPAHDLLSDIWQQMREGSPAVIGPLAGSLLLEWMPIAALALRRKRVPLEVRLEALLAWCGTVFRILMRRQSVAVGTAMPVPPVAPVMLTTAAVPPVSPVNPAAPSVPAPSPAPTVPQPVPFTHIPKVARGPVAVPKPGSMVTVYAEPIGKKFHFEVTPRLKAGTVGQFADAARLEKKFQDLGLEYSSMQLHSNDGEPLKPSDPLAPALEKGALIWRRAA